MAAGLVACAFKHNEQKRWNESKQQNWKAFNVSLLSWYAMPGHLWGSDWWWQDYEYEDNYRQDHWRLYAESFYIIYTYCQGPHIACLSTSNLDHTIRNQISKIKFLFLSLTVYIPSFPWQFKLG